jgi:hypothetical protein
MHHEIGKIRDRTAAGFPSTLLTLPREGEGGDRGGNERGRKREGGGKERGETQKERHNRDILEGERDKQGKGERRRGPDRQSIVCVCVCVCVCVRERERERHIERVRRQTERER